MAVTRKEQIASGKKVTPITREECILAGKSIAPLTEDERFMDVAYSGKIIPEGTIEIKSTEEVDVSSYAKAQVVDENLIESNIKKGVEILGVTGTYEGEAPVD